MRLAPISRSNFIKRLRRLGWEGPLSGGKHEFMVKGRKNCRYRIRTVEGR